MFSCCDPQINQLTVIYVQSVWNLFSSVSDQQPNVPSTFYWCDLTLISVTWPRRVMWVVSSPLLFFQTAGRSDFSGFNQIRFLCHQNICRGCYGNSVGHSNSSVVMQLSNAKRDQWSAVQRITQFISGCRAHTECSDWDTNLISH